MASEGDKNWVVYMLRCADGTLYTGMARDLEHRVAQHNAGRGAKYTRGRLPVRVVFSETLGSRSEALKREAQLKRLPTQRKRALVSLDGT